MAIGDLLDAVSALLKTCRGRRWRSHPALKRRQRGGPDDGGKRVKKIIIVEEEVAVWQRTILLGRKCRPLDHAEAIHYDIYGRQIPKFRPPPPLLRFKLVQLEEGG